MACFQVIHEGLKRDAGSKEDGSPAKDIRIAVNNCPASFGALVHIHIHATLYSIASAAEGLSAACADFTDSSASSASYFFRFFRSAMPSSRSCASLTGVGASIIKSTALAVLGKAITSRMLDSPASSMTVRS